MHKNLITALHYAFRMEDSSIAIIDLASIKNIEHVFDLRVRPAGNPYQGRGEYLIYGEIRKELLLKVISISEFLNRISTIPDDLFKMQVFRTSSSTNESRKELRKILPR